MKKVTIDTIVNAPLEEVWLSWTLPEHIVNWNFASDEWHCPSASNDLKVGGSFVYRMEAKNGSAGFDFTGTYTEIIRTKLISYQMEDDRRVSVIFEELEDSVRVVESFETENENSAEQQRQGWQAILNNFKSYTESLD